MKVNDSTLSVAGEGLFRDGPARSITSGFRVYELSEILPKSVYRRNDLDVHDMITDDICALAISLIFLAYFL